MFLSSTASSSQPCHITEGLFFVIPSGVELNSIDLFRCPFEGQLQFRNAASGTLLTSLSPGCSV